MALARESKPTVYLEDLCFDAQQAAEKAIKAVMIAEALSQYAWATRYPGTESPVTPHEHARAVEMAEAVVSWAQMSL